MAPLPLLRAATLALACAAPLGCADPQPPAPAPSTVPGFPLAIPGPAGTTVALAAPARRVLPGNAGALDLLSVLIEPERVVALTDGTVPYSVAIERGFDVSAIERVPAFDLETIIRLEPDLVVSHAWQSIDKGPFLRRVGLPVFEVAEPADFDALCATLTLLGRAVGEDARAAAAVADLVARRAALASVDRSAHDALTYSAAGAGAWTAAAGTTAATFMRWAGVTSAATAAGLEGHVQIDHERLLDLDPRILIVASDDGGAATSSTLTLLRGDERLAGLRALGDDGLVVVLPDTLFSCTSQFLMDAAEELAAAIDARWPAR